MLTLQKVCSLRLFLNIIFVYKKSILYKYIIYIYSYYSYYIFWLQLSILYFYII